MHIAKKIIAGFTLLALSLGFNNALAATMETESQLDYLDIRFSGYLSDNKISFSWSEPSLSGERIMEYKIMGENVKNPTYPKNKVVKTIKMLEEGEDGNLTFHPQSKLLEQDRSGRKDKIRYDLHWPEETTKYYRICFVTNKNNVYCSADVEKIEGEDIKNYEENERREKEEREKEIAKRNAELKAAELPQEAKDKIKARLENVFKKVEEKYQTPEERIEALERIEDVLRDLRFKKPKLRNVIDYVVDVINDQIDRYENGETEDIDSILEGF